MILIKNITLRNFLSIGAVTQAINFNRQDLTLILGENLDLGGDGARNGTGKTSLIQALCYALFGVPINSIRKDNLVNRTNGKGMMVTLEFNVNGIDYKIERGRKPNILRFYVNNDLQKGTDDAQGENKETQQAIEKIINMSVDMFKQIIALNTYSEPFLALKNNEQKDIIEQLLGITLLSEKAEIIKNLIKESKDNIQAEEFKVRAIEEANRRVQEQIDSLKRRQKLWLTKHSDDLEKFAIEYTKLNAINIDAELQAHKDLQSYNDKSKKIDELKVLVDRCVADEAKEQKLINKLKKEIGDLKNHTCYACGQQMHDSKKETVLAEKEKLLQEAVLQALATNTQYIENTQALNDLGKLGIKPTTHYKTEAEAIKHSSQLANILVSIENKAAEVDPYAEQIVEMESQALQEIDFDNINRLTRAMDHQKFLLDLLSSKDSFVRKKIIDQNLKFLNTRLDYYLNSVGLPHQVVFQNDLQVEITELGRELDFYNLSRGEMTRVILSLSWAFRDVWETLYCPINILLIDELLDSGMDAVGIENSISVLKDMSRRRNKSVWVISHREDLANRVNNVLRVVKENGFSTYSTSTEIESK
jgi:DNA repair exonuclease SbcCD ATPase subunit